ncbi:NAD(P)-dependent oxidoreductase [Streptomyces sp. B6B3]|uniref:NAD-dependent epimerase/dehydratase family protein n=1 Tax=Streptomyces sp. B6B3 TaxID=3153570 RepID=UPI00325F52C6
MRVFVTGATGAIGRPLVGRLLAAGHEVTGASRSPAGLDRIREQGAAAVRADALDPDDLRRVVVEASPDVVIHQMTDLGAADGAANGTLRRVGTRHLVDAARAAGVRRIVAQSISWAYRPGDGPADETVPLDPTSQQPRAGMVDAVRALEETAAELPEAVVLRYGLFYGPGTWYAPGGAIARALAGDPEARFLGSLRPDSAVSSFVHVDDAARAAVAALAWPPGPVNVVDDEPAAAADWLPALARALDVPAPEPVRAPRPTDGPDWPRGASNALARGRGWAPERPSWRTGFATQLDD